MGFYERQFGERDQEKKSKADNVPAQQKYEGIFRGNYDRLLTDNFRLILFFIPALVCLYIGLAAGFAGILLAALLLLIPAGPALAAMYDRGYQIARGLASHERRSFFESYRMSFKQGAGAMAALLPGLLLLMLVLLTDSRKPTWVMVCIAVGGYLLTSFAMYSFSQIALVSLPLRKIFVNAIILTISFGWKGVLVAAVQMLAVWMLYTFMGYAFLAFLILGPALLIAWSAWMLFPKLETLLISDI